MERIPKGIYTAEFRAEAVKVVEAEGLSIDQAAKRLSVPKSSLSNWVRAARAGKLAEVGKGQRLSLPMKAGSTLPASRICSTESWSGTPWMRA
jgi:transposase